MNSAMTFSRLTARLAGLFFPLALTAQSLMAQSLQGQLRFEPSREDPVWVGQQIELNLDLLSDGFSFSGQRFLLPDVDGAYLLQADSSTVNLTESRDGEAWQGLRYTILMYPQTSGVIEIPSFPVEFSVSAGYGSQPELFRFDTPVLQLEAKLPPGVIPGGLIVTSTGFNMSYSWKPVVEGEGPLQLKVGDALTLEVRRSADSVPGMVFSPLPERDIDGLQAYVNPPAVNDRMNRGQLSGSRTDSMTFICEREGVFAIPPLTFQWWDPAAESLRQEVVPGVTLQVAANPAFLTGEEPVHDREIHLSLLDLFLILLGLIIVAVGGWKLSGFIGERLAKRRLERESSEDWALKQAVSACRAGTAAEAYPAINRWLARAERVDSGITLLKCAESTGRAVFLQAAEELQSAVISGETQRWDGKVLAGELERFRTHHVQPATQVQTLPPLNPGR